MKEKFLNYPNLPENKVTTVFTQIDDNRLKNVFDEIFIILFYFDNIYNPMRRERPACCSFKFGISIFADD